MESLLTPKWKRYREQKYAAGSRNIDWQFTLETWLEWWGEDYHRRGQKANDLCMARHNDTGPYHPDNVYKCTQRQNKKDSHKFNPGQGLKPWLRGRNTKPFMAQGKKYKSRKQAEIALGFTTGKMVSYCKRFPDQYYFL